MRWYCSVEEDAAVRGLLLPDLEHKESMYVVTWWAVYTAAVSLLVRARRAMAWEVSAAHTHDEQLQSVGPAFSLLLLCWGRMDVGTRNLLYLVDTAASSSSVCIRIIWCPVPEHSL